MNNNEAILAVRAAFKNVLLRQPDPEGLNHYSNELVHNHINVNQLLNILRSSDEYKRMNVYLTPDSTVEFNGIIAYCQCVHIGDYKRAIDNIQSVHIQDPTILCIVIHDSTLNEQAVEEIIASGAIVELREWEDNLPKQRNFALELARRMSAEWVVSSDPDEYFISGIITDLRYAIKSAIRSGYDMLQINCNEYDGTHITKTNIFKDLIFALTPDVKFIGHGNLPIWHEGVIGPKKAIRLTRNYFYVHYRTANDVVEHYARDMFISGGGPSLGTENPDWIELKVITDRLNILTWMELKTYFKAGNIDKELKDYMIRHKDDNKKDGDQNVRAMFEYYFKILHPEEL